MRSPGTAVPGSNSRGRCRSEGSTTQNCPNDVVGAVLETWTERRNGGRSDRGDAGFANLRLACCWTQAGTSARASISAMSSRLTLTKKPADRAAMIRNTAPMAKPTV